MTSEEKEKLTWLYNSLYRTTQDARSAYMSCLWDSMRLADLLNIKDYGATSSSDEILEELDNFTLEFSDVPFFTEEGLYRLGERELDKEDIRSILAFMRRIKTTMEMYKHQIDKYSPKETM